MNVPRRLSQLVTVALVAAAVAVVVGQLLGYPVLFGFVTTGSMDPTLSPGDGFVSVPSALVGEPEPGDVVVFEAREIEGGGLTTHRIVDETDAGYVTKGDANPFTDQDGGEPHLSNDDVLAHALQVNDEVVVVPHLGTAAMATQAVLAAPFSFVGEERAGTVLIVLGLIVLALGGASGEGRQTSRSRSRGDVVAVWAVVFLVAGTLTLAATAAMVAPSGTYEIEVISTDDPTDDPQVVAPGETATATYTIHNGGVVPTLVVSDPLDETTTVDSPVIVLGYDQRMDVAVEMVAPDAPGEYTYEVRESRYLLFLPRSVLLALHSIHPLVAILAVDAAIALFVVAGLVAAFGTGHLRMRPRPDVPMKVRIRRWLRRID